MYDIRWFQLRWQLGLIAPEEVPEIATSLLARGVDGRALTWLAGITDPSPWNVNQLVEQAFEEAQLPLVTDAEARWLVVYDAAERIVAGRIAPLDGAGIIATQCRELDYPEPLRYFYYLWSDYGEGPSGEQWFDERIRENAAELLQERGSIGSSPPV